MSQSPQNPKLAVGQVSPGSDRAADARDLEIIVTTGAHNDAVANPDTRSMRSGKAGDPIALPYPEARYWGQKLGNNFFNLNLASQGPLLIAANGNLVVAADGSAIFTL